MIYLVSRKPQEPKNKTKTRSIMIEYHHTPGLNLSLKRTSYVRLSINLLRPVLLLRAKEIYQIEQDHLFPG